MATSTITIISGASTVTLDNTVSTITLGTSGPQGTPGEGVPVGGTAGQILQKDSATDYDTSWIDNFTTDVRQTIKNDSGSTLAKGTAVYVSGANGTNVLVKAALANADSTSATTIGLLYQQLTNNGSGYVVTEGLLTGIDTSAATAGDPVWLSGTVPGGLLFGWANEPKAPTHIVYLGTVARAHASLGEILVTIRNGWELDELHNVLITSPTNGQVLTYQSSTGLWVNSSETGDISAVNVTAPITGGGTSGAVTIGIDQTALAIAPSQVTGTAVITTDPRLSDARTPTAHASTHAAAGSDPVTLAQSQVTNLTTDLAGKAALASANTFTVGGHVINNAATNSIPLRINGIANQTTAHLYITATTGNTGQLLNVSDLVAVSSGGRLSVRDTTLLSASLNVSTSTASNVGALIRGVASQTGDLQQWQDSAANSLVRISAAGSVLFGFSGSLLSAANGNALLIANSSSVVPLTAKGASSQTANLQEWQNSAGTVLARVNSSGTFLVNGGSYMEGNGRTFINSSSAAFIPLTVRGTTSQTGNLTEWQDSGGTILARVGAGGQVIGTDLRTIGLNVQIGEQNSGLSITGSKATAAATNPGAGKATLYFRDGTTAGTLKLVVRAGAAGAETTILDNIPQ